MKLTLFIATALSLNLALGVTEKIINLECSLQHHSGTGTVLEAVVTSSSNPSSQEWTLELPLHKSKGGASIIYIPETVVQTGSTSKILPSRYSINASGSPGHNFASVEIANSRHSLIDFNFFLSQPNAALGAGYEIICKEKESLPTN